jgi:hypothetical protein
VPVQEVEQLADQRLVVGRADGVDAGRRALLDVGVEAGPAQLAVPVQLVVVAGADGERPQQQVERLPDGVGVGERALCFLMRLNSRNSASTSLRTSIHSTLSAAVTICRVRGASRTGLTK